MSTAETETDVAETTGPLLLGYLRMDVLVTERERADVVARLARFAQREGFILGAVFVEQADQVSAAFSALVAAAQRQRATAVVVPAMQHFSVLGSPACTKQRLEYCTGARVLIAGQAP